jgi:hypothetical protein
MHQGRQVLCCWLWGGETLRGSAGDGSRMVPLAQPADEADGADDWCSPELAGPGPLSRPGREDDATLKETDLASR